MGVARLLASCGAPSGRPGPDKVSHAMRFGWLIARRDYEAQRSGAGCLARCMTGAGDRASLEVMWPSCRGSASRPLPDRGRAAQEEGVWFGAPWCAKEDGYEFCSHRRSCAAV